MRDRVRPLTDAFVARRVAVTEAVAALPGGARGYVEETAGLVENSPLRIAGRLRVTRA